MFDAGRALFGMASLPNRWDDGQGAKHGVMRRDGRDAEAASTRACVVGYACESTAYRI
ncbi:hypothetical protein [Spirillospora sp. CA-128828]|uniref:hypothetical protein n=1 Tax=Spirillospora sp. CA-128828 TaxID=3240033 RepID=UPI003D9399E8